MAGAWSAVVPLALVGAAAIALVRTPRLRERKPGLAPFQRLGVFLLAAPILGLLLVGSAAVPALFDGQASAPLSPDRLADKTLVHLAIYLALPVAGLLLTLGWRGLADAGRRSLVRGPRDAGNLASALGWTAGASSVLIATVALAWGLGRSEGGGLLSAGGAEVVFSQTTPMLALVLAGVAALAEELLFRGVLLNLFHRRAGVVVGVGLQALLFGLIHAGYGSLVHVLAATAFGLAMGVLALHRGLVPAVGTHFLVNVAILGLWADHAELVGLALASLAAIAALAWSLWRAQRRSTPSPTPT